MKTKLCISLENLEKLNENFKIQEIKTIEDGEDYVSAKTQKYIVCIPNIKKIVEYRSLWTSKHLFLEDDTKISLYSDNVNIKDTIIERILNNKIISPVLKVSDDYVELTKDLREWLSNYGIPEYKIETYTKNFSVYHIIEYTGIGNVEKSRSGAWCYSSTDNPMKLTEEEINAVLNGINDELLKKKIEHLLYARIFKKIDF